jgi:hypothetical protein
MMDEGRLTMTDDTSQRVRQAVQALATDLDLIEKLDRVKVELQTLDNRCAFYENVYGRGHVEYQKVHGERDELLLKANRLLEEWIEERKHLPTPHA